MKNRFIFFDDSAIIEDYNYYTDYAEIIDDWLDVHGCKRTGMIIKFCNDEAKTLFALKWS